MSQHPPEFAWKSTRAMRNLWREFWRNHAFAFPDCGDAGERGYRLARRLSIQTWIAAWGYRHG